MPSFAALTSRLDFPRLLDQRARLMQVHCALPSLSLIPENLLRREALSPPFENRAVHPRPAAQQSNRFRGHVGYLLDLQTLHRTSQRHRKFCHHLRSDFAEARVARLGCKLLITYELLR